MKKISKTLLTLSLFGLAATALASCQETTTNQFTNNALVNDEAGEAVSYNIVNASSDYAYLDGLPGTGKAGQEYSFRVSLKPGYHFNDKLTIATDDGVEVKYTYASLCYMFTMPADNIVINLDVGQTDFTITSTSYFFDTFYLDDDAEEPKQVRSAVAGTKIKFQAEADDDFEFTKITMNGEELTEKSGWYHFTMPTKPAILASDKVAIAYDIELESELETATAIFYTDSEAKTPITKAIKGDTVYVKLTLKSGIEDAKYSLVAKPDNGSKLDVTTIEGEEYTYSFTMVSDDVTVTVTEKDLTPYIHSPFVNKEWKGVEIKPGRDGTAVSTKSYSELTNTYKFNVDATMDYSNARANTPWSWDIDENDSNSISFTYSKYSGHAVSTQHMAAIQDTYGYSVNAAWNDVNICLYDNTYDLHYMTFASDYALAWIQDENASILETIYIYYYSNSKSTVKTGVSVKKEDGTVALGSDITTTSFFRIYDGETELVSISSGVLAKKSGITINSADYVTCVAKNGENGDTITESYNGKTVYLYETLAENAASTVSPKKPLVSDASGGNIDVTEVSAGVYTFTMPSSAVTVTPRTADTAKYSNYPVLGKYFLYNLSSSYSGHNDMDFSKSTSSCYYMDVKSTGYVEQRSLTSSTSYGYDYTIDSLENTESGTMVMHSDTNKNNTMTVTYGNNLMVTPSSYGSSASYQSVYVGFKMSDNVNYTDVKTQVHYGMKNGANATSGDYDIWAISFYVSDTLFGSIFCYKGQIYTGVTFEYDEGSTRINSTSSYHIVKDDVTLYDVSNNVVTAATQSSTDASTEA